MNKKNSRFPQSELQLVEAEETLRLVATLPPPEGLADRVHHRLRSQPSQGMHARRGSFWTEWRFSTRLQFAGAAVVLVALASGGWTIYQSNHTQPLSPGLHNAPAGSFGGAGAVRVPPTIAPLHVPPAPKKKLNPAEEAARKAAHKSVTAPSVAAPDDTKVSAQP